MPHCQFPPSSSMSISLTFNPYRTICPHLSLSISTKPLPNRITEGAFGLRTRNGSCYRYSYRRHARLSCPAALGPASHEATCDGSMYDHTYRICRPSYHRASRTPAASRRHLRVSNDHKSIHCRFAALFIMSCTRLKSVRSTAVV